MQEEKVEITKQLVELLQKQLFTHGFYGDLKVLPDDEWGNLGDITRKAIQKFQVEEMGRELPGEEGGNS